MLNLGANQAHQSLLPNPTSAAGKQRCSRNAITHGLTFQSSVLASEDLAAYQRHCLQFQKAVDQLREIRAERRQEQERELKRAAALLELHKHKGIPYHPAEFSFVFSKDQIEAHSQRLMHLNESRHIEYVLFHMQPPMQREAARARYRLN